MKPIHILLAEDNEGDVFLIHEALNESKIPNHVSIVRDGKQAIDFIEKKGDYETAETPDLLLLDINLPKKNGHEVLKRIKANEATTALPVIVLTTSSSYIDILESYKSHASCYITKPVAAHQFLEVITSIENFWLSIVSLPNQRLRNNEQS